MKITHSTVFTGTAAVLCIEYQEIKD